VRAAHAALWGIVGLAALVLVYVNRDSWFGGDEWFIITDRGLTAGPGHQGLFEPHYEHWTTLPILAFRALYAVVGLHSYLPYLALVIVAHLAVVVLLWYVMIRASIDPWVATCACAVLAVLGTGFENLTSAWQVTLVAPLALGLGALLVAPQAGPFGRRDVTAVAFMTAAMMCSGVALPMLVSVALVALVRRGWRVAAGTAVVPASAYVLWFLAYGRDTPAVADPAARAIPDFLWNGLTDALGDVARVDVVGVIVVIALIAWVGLQFRRRPFDAALTVPISLAIGGLVFLGATGYRRGNLLGADGAASRYAYVTVVFMLPLIARASQGLFRGNRARRVLLAAVTIVLVVGQARELDHQTDLARPGKQSDRGAVLATAALARGERKFLLQRPLNAFEPQVTVSEIVAMDHDGKLPPLREATERDRLTVLARLDLVVGPDAVVPERPVARVQSTKRLSTTVNGDGCTVAHARSGNELVLTLEAPGTFRIRGEGLLGLRLRGRAGRADGEVVYSALPRDHEQVVSVASAADRLVVALPPNRPAVLCGLVQ
jgi:hypothetical protein